ncbi:MAG: hypothetical protein AB7V45_06455 [Candidatus Krumholzibacteriia bacterium]
MSLRSRHRLLFLLVLLCGVPGACALGAEAPATAAGPASDAAPRAALLLFMTRDQSVVPPLSPAEFRHACTTHLRDNLAAAGYDLVAQDEIMPLLIDWRVRDGFALRAGFLDDCIRLLKVGRIVVVDLVVKPADVLLLSRTVYTRTGTLAAVDLDQVALDSGEGGGDRDDGTRWLASLRELCGRLDLTPRFGQGDGSDSFVVLPTAGIGCSDDAALTATYCFLQQGQAVRGKAFFDPGLVLTTLRDRGIAPNRLDEGGRFLLFEVFKIRHAVATELITYDHETFQRGSPLAVEDPAGPVIPSTLKAFTVSARLIALGSGAVVEMVSVFRDDALRTGWFGVDRKMSLIDQLQLTAQELWLRFINNDKDS